MHHLFLDVKTTVVIFFFVSVVMFSPDENYKKTFDKCLNEVRDWLSSLPFHDSGLQTIIRNLLLSGSFLIKSSHFSPTRMEELTAGSDEKHSPNSEVVDLRQRILVGRTGG